LSCFGVRALFRFGIVDKWDSHFISPVAFATRYWIFPVAFATQCWMR